MRKAVIDLNTSIVENVVLAEDDYKVEGKLIVASDVAAIGDLYDDASGEFISPEPDRNPLYETAEAAKLALYKVIDDFTASITGPVPNDEKASWPTKEAAARAHKAGTASDMQEILLSHEAAFSGESVDQLADKVIANVETYLAIVGSTAGIRRASEVKISAVSDDLFQYEAIISETSEMLNGLLS